MASIRDQSYDLLQWAQSNTRLLAYGILLFGAIATAVIHWLRGTGSATSSKNNDSLSMKAPQVKDKSNGSTSHYVMDPPGHWTPSKFERPSPPAYPGWSLSETKPLPYRPFRPKYYVTLGLRIMNWDEWIELDNEWPKYHKRKLERIEERGEKCCRTAPEAFDGAVELLEEFCDYLPQRYPSMFRKTDVGMDNIVTGEKFNIVERPLVEDPMQMAARMVQDDLALMYEGKDGQYYLLAGAILLPGFWRLQDKFGMALSEIHTTGDVPQFREKLEKGMMNFFRRLKCEAPMLRNNYFFQVDDDVAWSHIIGSEDGGDGSAVKHGWDAAEKNRAIEHHRFRSERQSLRRSVRIMLSDFAFTDHYLQITSLWRCAFHHSNLLHTCHRDLQGALRSWAIGIGAAVVGRRRKQVQG